MIGDRAPTPRQRALTGVLRCYYADARHHRLRPHCEGIAVVAYGPTRLCATCDALRSSVGKGTAARPVPGVELTRLIDAARTAADAADELDRAAHAARTTGASWTDIGDAVGLTRQAAQQRWGGTSDQTPDEQCNTGRTTANNRPRKPNP